MANILTKIKDRLTSQGHENLSSEPIQVPLGMKRPETLAEQVQRLVRTSVSEHARMNGMETFEESEDFEIEDDLDFSTPYETHFDPVLGRDLSADEFRRNSDRYYKQYLDDQKSEYKSEELQHAISPKNKRSKKPKSTSDAHHKAGEEGDGNPLKTQK